MKLKALLACALCLTFVLSACGQVDDPAAAKNNEEVSAAEQTVTETSAAESEAAAEETEMPVWGQSTETATVTEQTEVTEVAEITEVTETTETTQEMNGAPDDDISGLLLMCGRWRGFDCDTQLTVSPEGFTLTEGTVVKAKGVVVHEVTDSGSSYLLSAQSGGLPEGTSIKMADDGSPRLVYTEGNTELTFYYVSALNAREAAEDEDYTEVKMFMPEGLDTPLRIVFTPEDKVYDLTLLKLEYIDSDGSVPEFQTQELFTLPELDKDERFITEIEAPGTVPAYGISYSDEYGIVHRFDLGISGFDGSITQSAF